MDTETKEVAVVKQQATKAVTAANELVIKTDEDMSKATDILSKIKTVAKMAKERKELITKPLNEALASARDLFKPIEQNCADAEKIIKSKMITFSDAQDAIREKAKEKIVEKVEAGKMTAEKAVEKLDNLPSVQTTTTGKVGQVQTRMVTKYRIVDETKIPRLYMVPDMAKITEAIKAGTVVPGAESYTEKVISAR